MEKKSKLHDYGFRIGYIEVKIYYHITSQIDIQNVFIKIYYKIHAPSVVRGNYFQTDEI